ncbi:MAG: hypothetical protein ACLPTJ_16545 [Solirubrobacteraceae bacterium]
MPDERKSPLEAARDLAWDASGHAGVSDSGVPSKRSKLERELAQTFALVSIAESLEKLAERTSESHRPKVSILNELFDALQEGLRREPPPRADDDEFGEFSE